MECLKLYPLFQLLVFSICSASSNVLPPFICVRWPTTESNCPGGNNALSDTSVNLTYLCSDGSVASSSTLTLRKNNSAVLYSLTCNGVADEDDNAFKTARYFFMQMEHGGGLCNCVDVFFESNCSDGARYDQL